MKKVSMLMIALLLGAGLQAQELATANGPKREAKATKTLIATKSLEAAAIKWEATTHNFGEIAQGVPVSTTFTFTNTSNEPLLIKEAKGSCGCTVTTYSKEAIAPGKQGFVSVNYNAASPGAFRKTVTVTVNTQPEPMVLSVQGTVMAPENR